MKAGAACRNCGHAWKSHRYAGPGIRRGECCAGDRTCDCEQYTPKPRIRITGRLNIKRRNADLCPACRAGSCHCNGVRCWRVVADEPYDYVCLHNAERREFHDDDPPFYKRADDDQIDHIVKEASNA